MKIRIKKRYNLIFFNVTLICVVYFWALQILYSRILQPIYEFSGFFADYNAKRCVIAYLMLIPAIWYLSKCEKYDMVSWKVVGIMLLTTYIPSLTLYIYMDAPFIFLYFLYFALLMSATFLFKDVEFKIQIKNGGVLLKGIGLIIGILVIYIWGKYSNFHVQMSFLDVYGQREISANYNISRLARYFFCMLPSIIPVFVVYHLDQKKYLKVIYYMILQYLIFCVYAEKSSMFYLVLAVLAYYGIKNYGHIIEKVMACLILGVITAFVESHFFDSAYITGILYRRILFVPSKLNYDYYHFFSENPFDYLRAGILRFLLRGPYSEVGIAKTIGNFIGTGDSANNGLFSDAYANFGVAGIFVMPILIALLLKVLDGATRHLELKNVFIVIVIASGILVSSFFFTGLISHGLLMMIAILCLFPRRKETAIVLGYKIENSSG